MALKDKAGLITLVAGVLILVAFFLPWFGVMVAGMFVGYWVWGLAVIGPAVGFVIEMMLMTLGIILLVLALISIATGVMARKREDVKTMGIIWLACGVISLIVVFITLASPLVMIGVSFGFIIGLVGAIIEVLAGVLAFRG